MWIGVLDSPRPGAFSHWDTAFLLKEGTPNSVVLSEVPRGARVTVWPDRSNDHYYYVQGPTGANGPRCGYVFRDFVRPASSAPSNLASAPIQMSAGTLDRPDESKKKSDPSVFLERIRAIRQKVERELENLPHEQLSPQSAARFDRQVSLLDELIGRERELSDLMATTIKRVDENEKRLSAIYEDLDRKMNGLETSLWGKLTELSAQIKKTDAARGETSPKSVPDSETRLEHRISRIEAKLDQLGEELKRRPSKSRKKSTSESSSMARLHFRPGEDSTSALKPEASGTATRNPSGASESTRSDLMTTEAKPSTRSRVLSLCRELRQVVATSDKL